MAAVAACVCLLSFSGCQRAPQVMPQIKDTGDIPAFLQEKSGLPDEPPSERWQSRSNSRPPGVKVFATTTLSDFIGSNLVNGSNYLILKDFANINEAVVADAFQEATNQNPLIMVHSDYPKYTWDNRTKTLFVKLPDGSRRAYKAEQEKLLAAAKRVVDAVAPDWMPARSRALALSKWVSENVRYDDAFAKEMSAGKRVDDNYRRPANATGGLLDKKAVCTGFARTYQLLAQVAGLDSVVMYGVVGKVAHTWNQVKIDGQWLNIDTTFNATDHTDKYNLLTNHKIQEISPRTFDYSTALVDASIDNFKKSQPPERG